ncbi:hypothetical protein PM082_014583 [Marasmius tenuissimus]|nr:hypothetical protein PM082_014583 [Marasmius tenuissimus]
MGSREKRAPATDITNEMPELVRTAISPSSSTIGLRGGQKNENYVVLASPATLTSSGIRSNAPSVTSRLNIGFTRLLSASMSSPPPTSPRANKRSPDGIGLSSLRGCRIQLYSKRQRDS